MVCVGECLKEIHMFRHAVVLSDSESGGEEEPEILDKALVDARVKSETELARKVGMGCIARVKDQLLKKKQLKKK